MKQSFSMKSKALFLSICISLTLFFSGCLDEYNSYDDPNTFYVSLDGNYDYVSIQKAIDDAPENYTIYLLPGHYMESVLINKTIDLVGEDQDSTIIDANHTGDVIKIIGRGNVTLSNLTLINSGDIYKTQDYDSAIDMHCNGNHFSNLSIRNNYMGIWSYSSNENKFEHIYFNNNSNYAMYLYSSSNDNLVDHCVFYKNRATTGYALRIKTSRNNLITNNYFGENGRGIYFCCGSSNNRVYHNSFINNTQYNARDDIGNRWHNGLVDGGNYWSDYEGIDENNDGFGDTPYNISLDGMKQDPYPLMEPPVTFNP